MLIIGSGIAEIQIAHHLSTSFHVRIITKSIMKHSNSYLAQGGIAAALSKDDDYQLHYEDTLDEGRYLHNENQLLQLVKDAPNLIQQLIVNGVPFDMNENGELSLGKEGAHSRSRIVHSGGDATGKFIMDHLLRTLPNNVQITENEFVFQLLIQPIDRKCIGVKIRNSNGMTKIYTAQHIVLATGGIGDLYPFTSNSPSVSGDGIALAYMAGAKLTDLEFIQFHPTILRIQGRTCGLISEVVRGMGAILVNNFNEPIMADKHKLKDLAPRHIVAEAIYYERLEGREVYLDIHMIKGFKEKFPTITKFCNTYHIDLSEGKIPVAPGCHFFMGGIVTDEVGRTTIQGLYAIGETAWTGVHGANRLASNSLLEGLYFGKKLANFLNDQTIDGSLSYTNFSSTKDERKKRVHLPNKQDIRHMMMQNVGIIRTKTQLEEMQDW
ncbi:L-aspartate oxidase [Heyndrickxia sporothermodurans]